MNKFIVDYDKKTLQLSFEGEIFNFDLNDGDVGAFWNSFTDKNGVVRDINFHQEDEEQEPTIGVYDLKEETHEGETYMTIDYDKETYIDVCEKIGDVSNYFGYEPSEDDEDSEEADFCPNCASDNVWRNSSDQLQCDNCGHEENSDEE